MLLFLSIIIQNVEYIHIKYTIGRWFYSLTIWFINSKDLFSRLFEKGVPTWVYVHTVHSLCYSFSIQIKCINICLNSILEMFLFSISYFYFSVQDNVSRKKNKNNWNTRIFPTVLYEAFLGYGVCDLWLTTVSKITVQVGYWLILSWFSFLYLCEVV